MENNSLNRDNNEFTKMNLDMNFMDNLDNGTKSHSSHSSSEKIYKANPIAKEDKNVTFIQENNEQIDKRYEEDLNKEWSIPEKIINRSAYKVVVGHRKELFKASAEYKIKYFKTVHDGRLEALREKTDAGLKMIKGEYRQQVAQFMMAKMSELAKGMKVKQDEFLTMTKEKLDEVERLESYPPLKNKYLNSVLNEVERYMGFLDRLVIRFENIVDEELQKYE